MKTQKAADIHRFNDLLAIHFEDTPTLYLTPSFARQLAQVLKTYANDIETQKFTDSKLETHRLREGQ